MKRVRLTTEQSVQLMSRAIGVFERLKGKLCLTTAFDTKAGDSAVMLCSYVEDSQGKASLTPLAAVYPLMGKRFIPEFVNDNGEPDPDRPIDMVTQDGVERDIESLVSQLAQSLTGQRPGGRLGPLGLN